MMKKTIVQNIIDILAGKTTEKQTQKILIKALQATLKPGECLYLNTVLNHL
jgi:hypothetical protein